MVWVPASTSRVVLCLCAAYCNGSVHGLEEHGLGTSETSGSSLTRIHWSNTLEPVPSGCSDASPHLCLRAVCWSRVLCSSCGASATVSPWLEHDCRLKVLFSPSRRHFPEMRTEYAFPVAERDRLFLSAYLYQPVPAGVTSTHLHVQHHQVASRRSIAVLSDPPRWWSRISSCVTAAPSYERWKKCYNHETQGMKTIDWSLPHQQ